MFRSYNEMAKKMQENNEVKVRVWTPENRYVLRFERNENTWRLYGNTCEPLEEVRKLSRQLGETHWNYSIELL